MKIVDEGDAITRANNDIQRAEYGRQAMANPLVREYFIVSRAARYERIGKTKPKDSDEREQIYLELQELERFEQNFENAMLKGKTAESWLTRLAQQAKAKLHR